MKKILAFFLLSAICGGAALADKGDVFTVLTPGETIVICSAAIDVDAQLASRNISIYTGASLDSNNRVIANNYIIVKAPFSVSDLTMASNGNVCVLVTKR